MVRSGGVQGFIVSPGDDRVTHVLLQEGHQIIDRTCRYLQISAASEMRVLCAPVTFTTRVWPRRPQVRPLGGLKPWPDSSSKQSQAPSMLDCSQVHLPIGVIRTQGLTLSTHGYTSK